MPVGVAVRDSRTSAEVSRPPPLRMNRLRLNGVSTGYDSPIGMSPRSNTSGAMPTPRRSSSHGTSSPVSSPRRRESPRRAAMPALTKLQVEEKVRAEERARDEAAERRAVIDRMKRQQAEEAERERAAVEAAAQARRRAALAAEEARVAAFQAEEARAVAAAQAAQQRMVDEAAARVKAERDETERQAFFERTVWPWRQQVESKEALAWATIVREQKAAWGVSKAMTDVRIRAREAARRRMEETVEAERVGREQFEAAAEAALARLAAEAGAGRLLVERQLRLREDIQRLVAEETAARAQVVDGCGVAGEALADAAADDAERCRVAERQRAEALAAHEAEKQLQQKKEKEQQEKQEKEQQEKEKEKEQQQQQAQPPCPEQETTTTTPTGSGDPLGYEDAPNGKGAGNAAPACSAAKVPREESATPIQIERLESAPQPPRKRRPARPPSMTQPAAKLLGFCLAWMLVQESPPAVRQFVQFSGALLAGETLFTHCRVLDA